MLSRERIDLVHAHESAPAIVARLATMGTKIPVLLTFHGAEPSRIASFGRIARFTADLVLTPSFASARDLTTTGGLGADKVQVMGLGIQKRQRPSRDEVAHLRAKLLGADGSTLVVTVARLAHQKAIDVLIEVARRALAENGKLRFAVVGDGPQRADALGWAAAAGITDRIAFVGHSDQPQLYLAAADIFLLPSRWESLPLTIVEAFREGVPVVATCTGGVRELVDDSVGAVENIEDAEAMARQVIRLAADADLRKRLGANAMARSHEDRFIPERVYAQFEKLYSSVLNPGSRK